MQKYNKKLKIEDIVILAILAVIYVLDIFVFTRFLGRWFGNIGGTVVHEAFLAVSGIMLLLIFRKNIAASYPFHKPELRKIFGTIVFWIGVFLITILVTGIVTYFFPRQVMGASEGVNQLINNMPLLIGVLVVALTPAICEEFAFRGALFGRVKGTKWEVPGLILISLFFGACHGSIWRMVPTAILGFAMGYLLLKTDNMIYNMLFHFVNNGVPVLITGILAAIARFFAGEQEFNNALEETVGTMANFRIPLASVGFYFLMAGVAPLLIYLGDYLVCKGMPGYTEGVFPEEKNFYVPLLLGSMAFFWILGILLIAVNSIIGYNI